MTLLKARELRKTFTYPHKRDILRGIDLDVQGAESVAIVGRSGEGKSTLLQILGTLDQPTSGKLWIQGELAEKSRIPFLRNRVLAFVFQSFFLLEDYSVLDNILMPAKIGRCEGVDVTARATSLLEKVGLQGREDDMAKVLSGGEKQRVAVARALIMQPRLLFADEPTGNLDHTSAKLIEELLLDFGRTPGQALVLVTHDQSLANRCHRCLQLESGGLTNNASI